MRSVTVEGIFFGAHICGRCDKVFLRKHPNRVYKFCSTTCASKSTVKRQAHREFMTGRNLTGENRSCVKCGTKFYASGFKIGRGWGVYCSAACRGNSGSKSGLGRIPKNKSKDPTEAQLVRRSPEYKAWRLAVFERDNYTCQFCGARGVALNADHIKSFAYFPELRLDLGNGRTLCVPCHKTTPTFGANGYKQALLWVAEV